MKHLLIYLLTLAWLSNLVACTSTPSQVTNPDIVSIELPLRQNDQLIKLSELADSIRYIPLQTTDSCLIGSIDKLLQTDKGKFVIVDKETAVAVYLFDKNGRFLNHIGRQGQGYGEYVSIEDVTWGDGYVYVWDSNLHKVLKYTEQGKLVNEFKFDHTAYSVHSLQEDVLAFACDYTPNHSLKQKGKYPNLLIYDATSDQLNTDLYFDERMDGTGFMSTLNNLTEGNLYLPLNDTLYTVDKTGASAKYVLRYADRYEKNKEEYIRTCLTEPITADKAEDAFHQGAYPHLITYLNCDSLSLLFMRMKDRLYYGFYYPHTGIYKEANSTERWPIVNDLHKTFLFSPRCAKENRVYCVTEPSAFLKENENSLTVREEDNPIIVEIFMKAR